VSGDIGTAGVLVACGLVVVAVLVCRAMGLRLEWQIAGAAIRAAVQLAIVGAGLLLVVDDGAWIGWSWIWVLVIVAFTGVTLARRAPQIPRGFWIGALACAVTAAICLGAAFGLGMFPLEPRTLVPVAGMTIGNSLTAMIVAATQTVREVSEGAAEIEARLALGLDSRRASLPSARAVMRAAISPQIERTRAVGIVFLPGAMVGLILAGVDPLDAVLVQGALMFLILASVVLSTVLVVRLGMRALFTDDHRLMPIAREDPPARPAWLRSRRPRA